MAYIKKRKSGRYLAEVDKCGVRKGKTFDTEAQARDWAQRQELLVNGSLCGLAPKRLLDAAARCAHSYDDILAASIPCESTVGVYFLIRDYKVVYVGQTTDLFQRLWKHRRSGKLFDSFSFIPCAKVDLNAVEADYIALLMPEENKQFG